VVAAILEKSAIEKILNHLGIPTELPPITPARAPPQMEIEAFYQIPSQDFNDF